MAVSSLDAAEFRRHLQGSLKPSSVNTRLCQLKAVFAWAAQAGVIERDPLRDLRQLPEGEVPVRTLDRRAVAAPLREAQKGGGARDVALLMLLAAEQRHNYSAACCCRARFAKASTASSADVDDLKAEALP